MRFHIRGKNVEVTDALRQYAEKKISRLEKYFETKAVSDVYVAMSVNRSKHSVEVTIPVSGVTLRAEERSDDMYASIDLVIDKLERQIRKYKTRVNRKARLEAQRAVFKESAEAETAVRTADEEEEGPYEVVRTKRFQMKPMNVEEAILQMNLLGHNFYVFVNTASSEVNVVYRRDDGRYGLIEPEM